MPTIKKILKDLLPPICIRTAKSLTKGRKPNTSFANYGKEQPAEYYDQKFEGNDHWKSHYTSSHYYPLWTVIADRLKNRGGGRVLDIGCGPGQVACLLRDTPLIKEYVGVDFSAKRIEQAKQVCPEFNFEQVDVFKTDLLETLSYDTVLIMEFLEHIEKDLEVLERLPAGVYVLATVPNFASAGHVRFFETCEEVKARYEGKIDNIRVDEILANEKGKKYFIIEGMIVSVK